MQQTLYRPGRVDGSVHDVKKYLLLLNPDDSKSPRSLRHDTTASPCSFRSSGTVRHSHTSTLMASVVDVVCVRNMAAIGDGSISSKMVQDDVFTALLGMLDQVKQRGRHD